MKNLKKIFLATAIFLVLFLFFTLFTFTIIKVSDKKIGKDRAVLEKKETLIHLPFLNNIPLDNATARVSKKPFGLKVSPNNSPVSPEKFSGFHTGTDFEIFENEVEKEIRVRAICDGDIMQKTSISGYGGIIIQKCEIKGSPALILYGHLNLKSATKKTTIKKNDFLSFLAPNNSPESGFERKHLHLGIVKGEKIDYHGYVPTEKELSQWIDPILILK